jgi:hypothetical protein
MIEPVVIQMIQTHVRQNLTDTSCTYSRLPEEATWIAGAERDSKEGYMQKLRIFVLALSAGAVFALSASPAAFAGEVREKWQAKKAALMKVMNVSSSKFQGDLGPNADEWEATRQKIVESNLRAGPERDALIKRYDNKKDAMTKTVAAYKKTIQDLKPTSNTQQQVVKEALQVLEEIDRFTKIPLPPPVPPSASVPPPAPAPASPAPTKASTSVPPAPPSAPPAPPSLRPGG